MDEDRQVKILCVDDERNVLRALSRLFLDENYEILTADSAEKGLEVIAEHPDIRLVISDYRMPGINGVDFLSKVHGQWPGIMRIILSGYADTAAVVSAINVGQIYRFIPKPWDDNELKEAISKALEIQGLQEKNLELTRALQESNEELKALNENLELLVQERTAELVFKNRVLVVAQDILDSVPVGIVGLDDRGLIVQCNRAGTVLLSGGAGSPVGRSAGEVFDEEALALIGQINDTDIPEARVSISGKMIRVLGSAINGREGQKGRLVVLVPGESAAKK